MGRKWICGRIHGSCGMRILNQKLEANDTSNPMLVSKLTLPNNKGWDKWCLESIFSQQSVDIFAVSISPQPQFCLLGHQLYHSVDQSLQIGQDMDVIAPYATNEPLSSWIYESSSTNLALLQSVKSFYDALVSICVNNILFILKQGLKKEKKKFKRWDNMQNGSMKTEKKIMFQKNRKKKGKYFKYLVFTY